MSGGKMSVIQKISANQSISQPYRSSYRSGSHPKQIQAYLQTIL